MVLFNYSTKELTAKVVYYGPGLCGKTTNLQWIHEKLPIKHKGKMLSLATETDRTLFFDFLPIELGTIRGMRTRIQLYTVPGQVFYNATRRMVLKGADCIVFVADSQEPMLEANAESLENLRENLEVNEIDPDEIPLVIQYNKRDLPNALPIEILDERLNPRQHPTYEAVAVKGQGVEETLKGVTSLVFRSLAGKYGGASEGATPPLAAVPPPPKPPVTTAPALSPSQVRPPLLTPTPAAAGHPHLNLGSSAQPADELLSSLELEPATDAGGDLDLNFDAPPVVTAVPPAPIEELAFEDVAMELPLEELHAEPEMTPEPVGKATLVASADEAAELRRRISRPLSEELHLPPPADELQFEPEPAPMEVSGEDFAVSESATDTGEIEVDIELPLPEPEPAPLPTVTAGLRVGSQTLPPMVDARPAIEVRRPTPGTAAIQTPPVSIDLPARGGPMELSVPVEIRVEGSTAHLTLHLHLSLDLRVAK